MNIGGWLTRLLRYNRNYSYLCTRYFVVSYDQIKDYGNLLRAGKACCKSGRWKASIQSFEINMLINTARNKNMLESGDIHFHKTNNFTINERGKLRKIKAHHVMDRQVLKSYCTYELKQSIANYILPKNAASQQGKGTTYSIKMFRADLTKAYHKFGRNFYVVTCDYHDYFGSEVHSIIKEIIPYSDKRCHKILIEYLKCFSRRDNAKGIGIGGEPSQDISVVYASKVDRFLICDKRVLASGKYMDDFYFITEKSERARGVLSDIIRISNDLGLDLNPKRTKIYDMRKDSLIWLKKRTYISETGKIVMRLTRENISNAMSNLDYYKSKGLTTCAKSSILAWSSYAKPYKSRRALNKVIHYYMRLFGDSWDNVKKLFRRYPKGFNKTKKKHINYKKERTQRILRYIYGGD